MAATRSRREEVYDGVCRWLPMPTGSLWALLPKKQKAKSGQEEQDDGDGADDDDGSGGGGWHYIYDNYI